MHALLAELATLESELKELERRSSRSATCRSRRRRARRPSDDAMPPPRSKPTSIDDELGEAQAQRRLRAATAVGCEAERHRERPAAGRRLARRSPATSTTSSPRSRRRCSRRRRRRSPESRENGRDRLAVRHDGARAPRPLTNRAGDESTRMRALRSSHGHGRRGMRPKSERRRTATAKATSARQCKAHHATTPRRALVTGEHARYPSARVTFSRCAVSLPN